MELFDTHCHLSDDRFEGDLGAVIERMRAAGVCRAMLVADGAKDPMGAFEIAEANEGFLAAAGVHPHDASCWDGARAETLKTYLSRPIVRALGEIGLDYHYDLSPREKQIEAFEDQMDLALEMNLPVILHIREAHGPASEILSARVRRGRMPRGVMHCYTGSWESAKGYLNMGLFISFTGAVTFKNAPKVWEVAQKMPIDRLMVETDCPYMAPVPMRGQRNEPAYVLYVAARIAELRGMPIEELAEAATRNGERLFKRL